VNCEAEGGLGTLAEGEDGDLGGDSLCLNAVLFSNNLILSLTDINESSGIKRSMTGTSYFLTNISGKYILHYTTYKSGRERLKQMQACQYTH
jgi:hypothetical protein